MDNRKKEEFNEDRRKEPVNEDIYKHSRQILKSYYYIEECQKKNIPIDIYKFDFPDDLRSEIEEYNSQFEEPEREM